jgi:hypothetical protein
MKVILSLTLSDYKEIIIGILSVVKTLGPLRGMRVLCFACFYHFRDLLSGQGKYPEKGKRRIWFKFNFLKWIFIYLKRNDEKHAADFFSKIIEIPTKAFLSHFAPPAKSFTREFLLTRVWQNFLQKDYNLLSEIDLPQNNSISLHVKRCYINEVVREIGLMEVADRICYGDFIFWKDYHRNVKFSRDKTLLKGDSYCNHTLTWVD